MNDLSFKISATDMASNVLAAVGENVSELGRITSTAFDSIRQGGEAVANSVSSSSTYIVGGTGALSSVLGVVKRIGGLSTFAGSAIAGFGIASVTAAQKAQKELDKVGDTLKLIEAQKLSIDVSLVWRDSIDSVLANVKQVAGQIELATNIKSSKLVDVAGTAAKMGFNPAEMDQTLKGAAGLSAAFGISLEEGLGKVRKAAEGNFDAFENLIPGIENLATDQEKLAAVAKLASDGLTLQVKAASSLEGIFPRLSNGFGNMLERIGEGAPVVEMFSGVLSDVLFPAVDYVDQKLYSLGLTGDWVKESLKFSFATIAGVAQTTWSEFGLVLERAQVGLSLMAEMVVLDLQHAFTVKMPAYVVWFSDNFLNLLQDMGAGAMTIVSNLGINIADAFGEFWHYITEGWSTGESIAGLAQNIGEIATRNLLEGFEPVTEALPQIADRAMSEVEKSLMKQMAGIDEKLVGSFKTTFDNALAAINSSLAAANLDKRINLGKVKIPKPEDLLKSQTVDAKVNQALESRVMLRGPSDNPMQRLLAIQEKMLKVIERQENAKQVASDVTRALALNGLFPQSSVEIKMIGN